MSLAFSIPFCITTLARVGKKVKNTERQLCSLSMHTHMSSSCTLSLPNAAKCKCNSTILTGENDNKLVFEDSHCNLPSSVPQYLTFVLNVMAAVANSNRQEPRTRIFGNNVCNTPAAEVPNQSLVLFFTGSEYVQLLL